MRRNEAHAAGSVGSDDSHCSHRSMRVAASLGTAGGDEATEHKGNLADLGVKISSGFCSVWGEDQNGNEYYDGHHDEEVVVMIFHVARCMLLRGQTAWHHLFSLFHLMFLHVVAT